MGITEIHNPDGTISTRTVNVDGSITYHNASGQLHRLDGPAVENHGNKLHWVDGKLHNLSGPAIEWADGSREWWVCDMKVHPFTK